MNTWYPEENEFQGVVIDESTGELIAVTYKVGQDAEEIATLHNMVEDLCNSLEFLTRAVKSETGELYKDHLWVANNLLDKLKWIALEDKTNE